MEHLLNVQPYFGSIWQVLIRLIFTTIMGGRYCLLFISRNWGTERLITCPRSTSWTNPESLALETILLATAPLPALFCMSQHSSARGLVTHWHCDFFLGKPSVCCIQISQPDGEPLERTEHDSTLPCLPRGILNTIDANKYVLIWFKLGSYHLLYFLISFNLYWL